MTPRFLSLDNVLSLHTSSITRFGGEPSIRDRGLLESAIAQPLASFGGDFVHGYPFEMAAAYLFHIVSNHPFVDGNKRTGLAAALVFLRRNNISLKKGSDTVYDLTLGVAQGRLSKSDVAAALEALVE